MEESSESSSVENRGFLKSFPARGPSGAREEIEHVQHVPSSETERCRVFEAASRDDGHLVSCEYLEQDTL